MRSAFLAVPRLLLRSRLQNGGQRLVHCCCCSSSRGSGLDFSEPPLSPKEELEAEEVLARQQEEAFRKSERIARLHRCIRLADSDLSMFQGLDALCSTGMYFMPYEFTEAMRRIDHVPTALSFYKWVKAESRRQLDAAMYEALVKLLCDKKMYGNAWKLVDDMKTDTLAVPGSVFITIMKSCGRLHEIDEAIAAFDKVEKYGCKLNSELFNCIVQVLLRASLTQRAQEYIDKMSQLGFELEQQNAQLLAEHLARKTKVERSYVRLVEGQQPLTLELGSEKIVKLCKAEKLDEALSLFFLMTEQGFVLTSSVHERLVRSLAETGRSDDGINVVKAILRQGQMLSYFTAIWMASSLIFELRIREAFALRRKLRGLRFRISFYKFVNRLSTATLVKAAWDLLRFLKYSGYQPSRGTYIACHVALNNFLKHHGRFGLQDVIRAGGSPMLLPCNVLVKYLAMRNQWCYTWKFVRFMQQKNVQPNAYTYSCLIKCFYKAERMEPAWEAYVEMKAKGLFPDAASYECLIKDAAKTVSDDLSVELFEEMLERHGMPTPRERRMLIARLFYQHTPVAGLRIYRELKARGAIFHMHWRLLVCLNRVRSRKVAAALFEELEEDVIVMQRKEAATETPFSAVAVLQN